MKTPLLIPTLTFLLMMTACQTEEPTQDLESTGDSMSEHMEHAALLESDEDFVSMMIPHHQEAVDTAQVILEKSSHEELRAMAQAIVDAQSAEIEQMQNWGTEWFGESFAADANYEAMMPDLSVLEGDALDQAFILGMIDHHEMAIAMATEVQSFTKRPELLEMANAIITTQTAEIELLKSWAK